MDFDRIAAVLRALEREGVAYKIIGGVAMNLQGLARATRDLDIFVRTDEENVDRLRRALKSVFDDESIDDITAEDLAGEYPAIQYVPPVEGFHLDILARLDTAFDFDAIASEPRLIDDVTVQAATPATLYAMKHATVRPRPARCRLVASPFRHRSRRPTVQGLTCQSVSSVPSRP